jgi:hypothetical protein
MTVVDWLVFLGVISAIICAGAALVRWQAHRQDERDRILHDTDLHMWDER